MELDYFEAKDFSEKLFEGCLNYINDDLWAYKKKRLNIDFSLEMGTNDINAEAKVNTHGMYQIKLEMAAVNWIYQFYNRTMVNEGFYRLVSANKEYTRKDAALYVDKMAEMTIKNILYHECGHIFNGHVDFIKLKNDEYNKVNKLNMIEDEFFTLYEISARRGHI